MANGAEKIRREYWPTLDYQQWKDTYATLHRMTQIIGKVRMSLSPWLNHSWSTTLYVTARGLTTSAIPFNEKILTIDLDLLEHQVLISSSEGKSVTMPLKAQSVASFYQSFLIKLQEFGINPQFDPHPNECSDYIAFDQDQIHCHYNKEQVAHFFQVLVRVHNVMNEFRSEFSGKVSPVHFFWGSFDLAVTRFSGKVAPEHPGVAPHISKLVMKEGYSHELISCGFWPGNELFPEAAFYSYAYPSPEKFSEANIKPAQAFFVPDLGEYLLRYQDVALASHPRELILDFFHSTFSAAAELANWDKNIYQPSRYLQAIQKSRSLH